MPTYDYKCNECEHVFEIFQPMSEDTIKDCPECNGNVRRLVSGGTGLIFKGSGFYLTDYKNKSNDKKVSSSKKDKKPSKPAKTEKKETK